MCEGCWTKAGEPREWTPQTARFIELATLLYLDHPTGGPLHAVLDDWNLDGTVTPWHPEDFDAETREICAEIAAILNGMTVAQRYAAMAYWDGYITPTDDLGQTR